MTVINRISVPRGASPQVSADAILREWRRSKVIHLTGLGPIEDTRSYYETVVSCLGYAAPIAEDASIAERAGQRTGGTWMEVRYDPAHPNAYRHSHNAQPLHTDGSYIASFPDAGFLCCVDNVADGGETTFLDGSALVAILRKSDPGLLADLQQTEMPHERSGDRRVEPVIQMDGEVPRLNWNYYCVDMGASNHVLSLRERLHLFLESSVEIQSSTVNARMCPGDALIWKDDLVLHGRNSFATSVVSGRFFWKAAVAVTNA